MVVTGTTVQVRTYPYGSHPSQFVRLHIPPEGDRLPVAVVIHGGFWRQRYGVELAEPLCADLAAHGVAAAAVEYRRVDRTLQDGSRSATNTASAAGGGWPMTLADVARAVDSLEASGQVLARGRLDLDRVAAIGHSAGGHLAAWLTHRGSLRVGAAGSLDPAESAVSIRGAVCQAGVLDLASAARDRLGDGAVIDLMEGSPGSVAQRYHHASPMAQVGDGARVICVHGDADATVPVDQSRRYVDAAVAAGDPAELVVLSGVGHSEVIDVRHPAWATCRDRLFHLLA
jgi:acetyl esterase/lipase